MTIQKSGPGEQSNQSQAARQTASGTTPIAQSESKSIGDCISAILPKTFAAIPYRSNEELRRREEEAERRIKLGDRQRRWSSAGAPRLHVEHISLTKSSTKPGSKFWNKAHAALIELVDSGAPFTVALLGRRGSGKTQMAVSAMKHACDVRDKSVLYTTLSDLFMDVRETYGDNGRKSEREAILKYCTPDILVVDELDVCNGSQWERTILIALIDKRYRGLRSTILISNKDAATFASEMPESIISRMDENGGTIECAWESFRK